MEFFNPREDVDKTIHRLPHWQQGRVPVFCTFRLSDSLPRQLLAPLLAVRDSFIARHPEPWDESTEREFHRQFTSELNTQLNTGHGTCALRDSRVASILTDRLHHFHAQRYDLHAYVIMPNHVHVLFTPYDVNELSSTIKSWKGISSHLIHKANLSTLTPFWQADYFDRLIRTPAHFETVMRYIAHNPIKAKLRSGFVLWQAD